jgi:hypothetical protein
LATIGPAAQDKSAPTVVEAEPAPEWNASFAGKDGWLGGDGVYSVVLGPKRIVWLFGDTILGKVKDGKRTNAVMVNNTIAVQTGRGKDAPFRFVTGKTSDGKPASVFTPADGKGWFWPHAGLRIGDRFVVFLPQIEKTNNPGVFGFRQIGQWLAVIANPDDDPEQWKVKQHKLPFAEFGTERVRSWGSAVVEQHGQLYVFGYEERGRGIGKRRLILARVPANKVDDFEAWEFRSETDWSAKAADTAPLVDGLATEFSVTPAPDGKGFAAVYTENGLSDRIVGRFAKNPEGPWSAPILLYKCPEMAKDKGVFSYAARTHAWAASGNELVISYCVNAWDFGRLFRDETVYRPMFIRVKLGPPK